MAVDELDEFGLERMDDGEIGGFLSGQKTGVLGLPSPDGPYLLPISFGYDGDSSLYFTYVVGDDSRKQRLSDEAGTASFLVYTIDSLYSWESVYLTGTLVERPESDWDELADVLEDVWRPDVFRSAQRVAVYEFRIDERSGLRQTGLPPGFERPDDPGSGEASEADGE
jgi:hypothetical protein